MKYIVATCLACFIVQDVFPAAAESSPPQPQPVAGTQSVVKFEESAGQVCFEYGQVKVVVTTPLAGVRSPLHLSGVTFANAALEMRKQAGNP